MRLFQAALDTPLDSPLPYQPLSSRFALHSLRALDFRRVIRQHVVRVAPLQNEIAPKIVIF